MRTIGPTVLLAESEEELQRLLDVVVKESEKKELAINCKKTECLVATKKKQIPKCVLKVKKQTIKQVSSFNYLGSTITEDARCENKRLLRFFKFLKFSKYSKFQRFLQFSKFPKLKKKASQWKTLATSRSYRLPLTLL